MNDYLSKTANKIKSKSIPWEGYQRAGLLSVEDVQLIQKITASSFPTAETIWSSEGETYADLYLRLLGKLSRNDTLQFILVLLTEMIADRDDRIALFLSCTDSPYPILLKLIDSQDEFVQLTASVLISTFLSMDQVAAGLNGKGDQYSTKVATSLIVHLSGLIHKRGESLMQFQEVGVECLQMVLRNEKVRKMVWSMETSDVPAAKVIEGLMFFLRSEQTAQMQYQLIFCFWLLTFDPIINAHMNAQFHLIPPLTEIARTSGKEKVIRITISVFRNLLTIAPEQNIPTLVGIKLLPVLESLNRRTFSDEEITEELAFLIEELKKNSEGLTTYDEYSAELISGQLAWSSPPHSSDEFWAENASKLLESDKKVLRLLINLIQASQDAIVLAIAANDLAQFLKFCDLGKRAVEDLGARPRVMELMSHADDDVKFQALVCIQRLISQPWA